MKVLSLDTSVSKNLGLAISQDQSIISQETIESSFDLAEEIVLAIGRFLKKSDLSLNSLDGFAVNVGPGSFTGLRIGLSCVKALSFATGKPLVGVSSLDILASSAETFYQVCSIIDAKRDNVYACLYTKKLGKLKAVTSYLLMGIDSLIKKINKKTLFVGDGLYLYQHRIEKLKKGFAFFAAEKFRYPQIGNLAKIAYERFAKKLLDDPKTIVPIYLYPKECQIRKVK